MTERESSWALAPERNIDRLEKEPFNEWDGVFREVPSFRPELISEPKLREKARSSAYGKQIPQVQRVVLDDNELRPWQEQPTFKPELVPDKKRESAPSSGYGKVIPTIKKKEPESPSFKPELVRSRSANKMMRSVRSSNYGKEAASPKRPVSAPVSPFRPSLPKSKLRQSARSSGYGRKSVDYKRPQSAREERKVEYVPRYTLLKDKPEKQEEETKFEKDFVLDGVITANSQNRLFSPFGSPEKLKRTGLSEKLLQSATSSKYGVASPPAAPRPEHKPAEPPLKFDRSTSMLEKELEAFNIRSPLNEKVRSSHYGTAPPPRGEKPPPKEPEPAWNLTLRSEMPSELPPAPRSPLNAKVSGHGYGKVSPSKGPRYEIEPQPVWVPTNNKSVMTGAPPPVPRSKLNDMVKSHYGKDYTPPSARSEDDELYEEETQSTYVRAARRRPTEYEEEEDEEEEFADEDEAHDMNGVDENGQEAQEDEDDDDEAF